MSRKLIVNNHILNKIEEENYNNKELFNFTSELVFNFKKQRNELIDFEMSRLTEEEIIMFRKFDLNLSNEFVYIANRCSFDYKIYHSKYYEKAKMNNNYTICYKVGNTEFYGHILKFIQYKDQFYAFLEKIEQTNEILDITSQLSKNFKKEFPFKYFNKYFKCVNFKTNQLKLIKCENIICNCIIIKTDKYNFITNVIYNFEHD